MDPEIKKLIEESKSLIVQLQTKHDEALRGKIDTTSFNEFKSNIDTRLEAISNALVKLQAPAPVPAAEPKAQELEHKAAYRKFLQRGAGELTPAELKVMTISDLTTGGYLANPDEMVKNILQRVVPFSPIRSLATVIPTSAPGVDWPKDTGDFSAYRTSEIGTRSETTGQTFGMEKIPADEMYALVRLSKQNLEDSAFPLESYITQKAAKRFGVKEGTESILGTGASGQMEGILTNTSVTGFTGVTTSGKILADDLKQLFYSLAEEYVPNATWIWKRTSTLAISLLKDTSAGNYLWQPGLQTGTPPNVLGRPYVECPDMPAEANSAKAVAFGDFREGYVIVDRLGMETQRLIEKYAEYGQVGLLFRRRVGGQVVLSEAIKILTLKA